MVVAEDTYMTTELRGPDWVSTTLALELHYNIRRIFDGH